MHQNLSLNSTYKKIVITFDTMIPYHKETYSYSRATIFHLTKKGKKYTLHSEFQVELLKLA